MHRWYRKTHSFGSKHLLKSRDAVSPSLSTSSPGFGEDVLAFESERNRFGLDEGRMEELEVRESSEDTRIQEVGKGSEGDGGEEVRHAGLELRGRREGGERASSRISSAALCCFRSFD